jgi:hypothetical protein
MDGAAACAAQAYHHNNTTDSSSVRDETPSPKLALDRISSSDRLVALSTPSTASSAHVDEGVEGDRMTPRACRCMFMLFVPWSAKPVLPQFPA